jgi:hypothetical protein
MNAIEFVNKLREIPTKQRVKELTDLGLDKAFINEYINSFIFKPKERGISEESDEIINLVKNYIGNSVKIGMITFDIAPFEDKDYFFFGLFDVDHLVMSSKTGEILLVDYEAPNHIMQYCARNSECFLTAILEAAKFLEQLPYDDDLRDDQIKICEMASYCSNLAGGDKYKVFYNILIGCEN